MEKRVRQQKWNTERPGRWVRDMEIEMETETKRKCSRWNSERYKLRNVQTGVLGVPKTTLRFGDSLEGELTEP